MPVPRLPRLGFLATLATGVAMLGASVWGMADVESELAAAVSPQPQGAPPSSLVADRHDAVRDCPPHLRERRSHLREQV